MAHPDYSPARLADRTEITDVMRHPPILLDFPLRNLCAQLGIFMGIALMLIGSVSTAKADQAHLQIAERQRALAVNIVSIDQKLQVSGQTATPSIPLQLQADVTELKQIIDKLRVSGPQTVAAQYYVAVGNTAINSYNRLFALPINDAAAREADKNFSAVIAYGQDIPEWAVRIAEVYNVAGVNAHGNLKSEQVAFGYFSKCSAMGHLGCMNAYANLLLEKSKASRQEFEESYRLFDKIAGAGTEYNCAAIYSGESAALMAHFHLVDRPAGEEFALLKTVRDNFEALQKSKHTSDPCIASSFMLYEYLMHADEGDVRPQLLDELAQESASPAIRYLVSYLKGDKAALEQGLSALQDGYALCLVDFYRLWNAVDQKQHQNATEYFSKIKQIGPTKCRMPEVYAQKLNDRIAQSKPAPH